MESPADPSARRFQVGIVAGHDVEDSDVAALSQCLQLASEFFPATCTWVIREVRHDVAEALKGSLGEMLLSGILAIDAHLEQRRVARAKLSIWDEAAPGDVPPRVILEQTPDGAPLPHAIDTLHQAQLDLIFFLGAHAPPEWIIQVASRGVVSVRHLSEADQTRQARSEITFAPSTEQLKFFLHVKDKPAVCMIDSTTARRSISPSRNRSLLVLRSADLMVLVGRRVAAGDFEVALSGPQAPAIPQSAHEAQRVKSESGRAIRTTMKILGDRARAAIDVRFFEEGWCLAYSREKFSSLQAVTERLHTFEKLVPPPGAMWADPFPLRSQGRDLIFFEEEFRSQGYGHISVSELHPNGALTPPVRVLDIGSHLSYPHVFESDGEWFMIPESLLSGTVTLYRATEFPHKWAKECDLITDEQLVDCTVFRHAGQWWMLGCRMGPDLRPYEDLVAYVADTLTGPWNPHRNNPLVSDATRGRPAGQLFVENDKLVRPAQDCSVRYGYGLSFQEIVHLSATGYEERAVSSRVADWDSHIIGVHTFNRSESLSCTDFLLRQRRAVVSRFFSPRVQRA